ncbi:hypothetical protein FBU30_002633 [Linnemannia zychae]|nr:hypothetical protein FBU30_002633 [Linnemannia zychae]
MSTPPTKPPTTVPKPPTTAPKPPTTAPRPPTTIPTLPATTTIRTLPPPITNPIITVTSTSTTLKPTLTSVASTTTTGFSGNRNGGRPNASSSDGEGMSAAAIGGLVAGLAVVLVGSVVGGFLLLKQRRKRMMFVGHSASGSRSYGGDGYPDPPDLPRPRAGFHRGERPGSGSWSARSGYSSGAPSSLGRRPFANHSDIFDEKGYHAEAAGLGGARMSVMGPGGYNNNISGESFTQLHDGRFVANGQRGENSQNGTVVGDVDYYPQSVNEYNTHMYEKNIAFPSAPYSSSPPSSSEGAYPPEGVSPTESSSSSSARLQSSEVPFTSPNSPGPNPRASGYYDYNHSPLRNPSRTNIHSGPPMSPNGNFVSRSSTRMSGSIPYAPDGRPLFPPRPTSQYQHSNYQQQYPSPRLLPLQQMGGGGPNGYYGPRVMSQYGSGYPPPHPSHPYQPQLQHPQPRFLQQPSQHLQQMHSSSTSPMTSSSMTAYEDENGVHSPQKTVHDDVYEKHQVYEEIYVEPPVAPNTSQMPESSRPSAPTLAPASAPSPNPSPTPAEVATESPADLAKLTPMVPAPTPTPPPLNRSTKPVVDSMTLSS